MIVFRHIFLKHFYHSPHGVKYVSMIYTSEDFSCNRLNLVLSFLMCSYVLVQDQLKKLLQCLHKNYLIYNKTCLKQPHKKKTKIGFQDRLSLNAGQKYCRMEHSAILLTFINLPFVIKTFVLSIFEWPLKTCLLYYLMK